MSATKSMPTAFVAGDDPGATDEQHHRRSVD
jgi:hypothetical protein